MLIRKIQNNNNKKIYKKRKKLKHQVWGPSNIFAYK
jgi:hypothetical protein